MILKVLFMCVLVLNSLSLSFSKKYDVIFPENTSRETNVYKAELPHYYISKFLGQNGKKTCCLSVCLSVGGENAALCQYQRKNHNNKNVLNQEADVVTPPTRTSWHSLLQPMQQQCFLQSTHSRPSPVNLLHYMDATTTSWLAKMLAGLTAGWSSINSCVRSCLLIVAKLSLPLGIASCSVYLRLPQGYFTKQKIYLYYFLDECGVILSVCLIFSNREKEIREFYYIEKKTCWLSLE